MRSCWSKPFNGIYLYRFYFKNVEGRFEYSLNEAQEDDKKSDSYYTEVEPVFVVGDAAQYKSFDIESFKKDPSYQSVVEQLTSTIGSFD